jgi:DNA gyrase subunit A
VRKESFLYLLFHHELLTAGKAAARLKEEDSLEDVTSVHDHDHLLFFTTEGQAYALRAYEIPEASRTSIGTSITQVGQECL